MALRLVIADGHPIVRRGLPDPLGSESDFSVVATRSSGAECIRAIRQLRPQPALLALAIPGLDALGAPTRGML
jgi:DNA-binding NarL/FixJ family response regulator